MLLKDLYALTAEEFGVSDFQSTEDARGDWQISVAPRRPGPRTPIVQEPAVGRGATEEKALRELRVRLVETKFGEYRG